MAWVPPGNDCGACGMKTCAGFLEFARAGKKDIGDCPFYGNPTATGQLPLAPSAESGRDHAGFEYDFLLLPLPGEPSARKHIQLFRPELIDRWGITSGDLIVGRPVEPGCPITHVLQVLTIDPVTGFLTCHAVGPFAARREKKFHDVHAYREIAMEGIAEYRKNELAVGFRQRFLPANCMRQMVHSGVIQMILKKSAGMHVRIEEIQMHGKREKLKDVTIRPGDAVSIMDPAGSGKTIVIDGINVVNSDGSGTSRNWDGDGSHRNGKGSGGGHGPHRQGDGKGRHRSGDDG